MIAAVGRRAPSWPYAMHLKVRHKLLLLLAGALTAALLLSASMLTWLIGAHHAEMAGERTRWLMHEAGARLLERQERLAGLSAGLAAREHIVAALSPFARPDTAELDRRENVSRLAHELREGLVEWPGGYAVAAYDITGRLLIAVGAQDSRNVPGSLPDGAAAPHRALRLARSGNELVMESIVPVVQERAGVAAPVGWLRLIQPIDWSAIEELARQRGTIILRLHAGNFDAANTLGLDAAALRDVPPLFAADRVATPQAGWQLKRDGHFLHAAAIDLAGGEAAWLVAALDGTAAREEQARAQGIIFKLLAGTLLLVIPLAVWLERRWIVAPFETLSAGVHEYAQGNLDKRIALPTGDEFEGLAEDFNLLAVALRVREIAIREAEERWQFALDSAGHGVWERDLATGKAYYSSIWKAMLGHAEAEIGDNFQEWEERVHPDDLPQAREALASHLAGKSPAYNAVFRMRHKQGGWRWIFARGRVVARDPAGQPLRILGTHTDITERVAAEQAIREAATVFDATSEAILITDADGVIRRVNRAFSTITGYDPDQVIGQRPGLLASGRHDKLFYAALWDALLTHGYWEGEIWNRRKSGEVFPIWETISAVRNPEGAIVEFVALFSDITKKKRSEEEIVYRANYDALTGLPNRTLLAERLSQALRQARRETLRLAVLFIDLDHFKQVNDTLGHARGDRLLQAVAERMRHCVRESDTLARQGGDEFVVLLANLETPAAAGIVAGKIIAQTCMPFIIDQHEIRVGASVGITIYPDDGTDIDTLYRNADMAMYRAKAAGRNNAQFYSTLAAEADARRRP